ncbi:hypothetical protein DICVIV_07138 [Dictyocaulus viviparus]|uniref:Uncharacterized protein n=1 Tax=Dictyocaulus viviparus TaxID=29172 RepID=A0A0D8XSP2_DICVI|nr:hypothetical protein DICVIV_07138 [Dictyocaulus viviparus]
MHTPPAIYTLDAASDTNLIWSGPSRPELAIPHPVQLSRMGGSTFDSEQLMMKRNEIINRLAPLTLLDDDDLEDGVGHVSYTVASSVLDDRGELHPVTVVASPQTRGLPHISTTNLSSVQMSATTAEGPINVTVESSLSKSCHRAPGVTLMQLTSAVTARETSLLSSESPPLATVQSDCSIMQVKDSLNQSLPTPAVQRSQAPLPLCAVPLVFDSNIIRERIGVSSTGINQQLVAELRIPQREMNRLDQTLVHRLYVYFVSFVRWIGKLSKSKLLIHLERRCK